MSHQLPPLPYAYDALEPAIDEQTMRLHHDLHHKAYVDGLNKAEEMLAKARESGDYALVKHWEREAAFHGSGHLLHAIFWPNLAPAAAASRPARWRPGSARTSAASRPSRRTSPPRPRRSRPAAGRSWPTGRRTGAWWCSRPRSTRT